jgi:putative transposase
MSDRARWTRIGGEGVPRASSAHQTGSCRWLRILLVPVEKEEASQGQPAEGGQERHKEDDGGRHGRALGFGSGNKMNQHKQAEKTAPRSRTIARSRLMTCTSVSRLRTHRPRRRQAREQLDQRGQGTKIPGGRGRRRKPRERGEEDLGGGHAGTSKLVLDDQRPPSPVAKRSESRGREGRVQSSAPSSFARSKPLRRSFSTRRRATHFSQVPRLFLPSAAIACSKSARSSGAMRTPSAGCPLRLGGIGVGIVCYHLTIGCSHTILCPMATVTVQRAHKFRVYLTPVQEELFAQWAGAARWTWNACLAWRTDAYRTDGLSVTGIDFSRELTWLKTLGSYAWLNDVPATVFAQTLRDQDKAFANFFAKRNRYPRFKRRQTEASIRFQLDQRVILNTYRAGEFLKLPKMGFIDVRWSRVPGGIPKMATLSRDAAGRYFVSFSVEETIEQLPQSVTSVGVDVGTIDVIATSDGKKSGNPRNLKRYQRRLKRAQRGLSRKRKGSNRWKRQKARVARLHARVADTRRDYQHKLTTALIREHGVIAIEDLNVRGMTASAKGTLDAPGKKVAQKAGLNRSILDVGFGEIRRQLEYKAQFYGREIIAADRFAPTSKTCSVCGAYQADMPLKVRDWTCPDCATVHDRDTNAARNILAFAAGGRPVAAHRGRHTPSATIHRGRGKLAPVEVRTNPECADAPHGCGVAKH